METSADDTGVCDGRSPDEGRSIGETVRATGMSVDTLRFFEREGLLLRPVPRNAAGRRVYERADVDWLLLVARLRASGMPVATVARFAELVRSGPGNEALRLELLREHERAVRARIAALGEDLEIIRNKVTVYERHVREGTAAGVWAPVPSAPGDAP
ncbi:MerR family transcriptional regulator [Streptomyces mobaraensis]|uniref:MerR family transcriptional regulator n=1 Tax=Streptomyces mobaraensis TaxID=35621 RepID=A0A5N5VYZ4_STRMB|nr:MerR family transcriptional regulator [Streptomyces mobaraensis]KAB7833485.1 MerR family transcriptional regulator [Streptomyces mobaraensis]